MNVLKLNRWGQTGINKQRRALIRSCVNELKKPTELIAEIKDLLQHLLDAEDEARDNMPESLQETEQYAQSEEASEAVESALSYLDEFDDGEENSQSLANAIEELLSIQGV